MSVWTLPCDEATTRVLPVALGVGLEFSGTLMTRNSPSMDPVSFFAVAVMFRSPLVAFRGLFVSLVRLTGGVVSVFFRQENRRCGPLAVVVTHCLGDYPELCAFQSAVGRQDTA